MDTYMHACNHTPTQAVCKSELSGQFLVKSQVVYLKCCDSMKMKGHCPEPTYSCVDRALHNSGGAMYIMDIIYLHIYITAVCQNMATQPLVPTKSYCNNFLAVRSQK